MYVYVLIKNGRYHSVHRSYEGARETIEGQAYFSDFPDDYEIIEERI